MIPGARTPALDSADIPRATSGNDADGATHHGRAASSGTLAVSIGSIALLVNVVFVGTPGAWRDEAASGVSLDRSLGELMSMLGTIDLVHGLYYLWLRLWTAVFGDTLLSLRISSVLAVGVAAALVVLLGSRLFGRAAGAGAGLVFGLLPQVSWAAGEARSYALTCVAVTGMVLAFTRAVEAPSRKRWLVYAAVATVSVHLFLFAITVLLVLAIASMMMRREVRRPALLATAAAGLACVPLVVLAAGQRQQVAWLVKYRATPLGTTLEVMWGGNPWAQVAGAAVLVAMVGLTIVLVRREPGIRTSLALTWLWLVLPSCLLLAASAFLPLYHPRYVTLSAPALAILIGLLVSRARPRWARTIIFAAVVAVCVPQFVASREPLSKSTPAVAVSYILDRVHPGDCLYIPWRDVDDLQWAFPGLNALTNLGHGSPAWRHTDLAEPSVSVNQLVHRLDAKHRLWLIADGLRIDQPLLRALASRGYQVVEDERFPDAFRTRVVLLEPAAPR